MNTMSLMEWTWEDLETNEGSDRIWKDRNRRLGGRGRIWEDL